MDDEEIAFAQREAARRQQAAQWLAAGVGSQEMWRAAVVKHGRKKKNNAVFS